MTSHLSRLASKWSVPTFGPDGYDLEPWELRAALLVYLAAERDEARRIVDRLTHGGTKQPIHLFKGECEAARFALRVIDADMQALTKTVVDTTGEELLAEQQREIA